MEVPMGIVTIRLKEASFASLSEMANAHNHSLELEINDVLEKAISDRRKRIDTLQRMRAISAMTPKGVVQSDSTLLIREDRDR
jgi:hypothetical protein